MQINPEKVILFGSYAWGEPNEGSDIDLYVVTKENFMPRSFAEKMEMKMRVANQLVDFRKKYPTDLLVHTKPMYQKFIAQNSSFAKKMVSDGVKML